jgi:hypothetical protein
LTARDFDEMRDKTLALYQTSVRGVRQHTFDPGCQFRYPGVEQTGRWFGLCLDGQGTSDGYGLIQDGNGNVVEFVGTTRAGLANGNGAMIVRTTGEAGATYYEGSFADGLPDGVLLVEEPGRKPRIRTFRAGSDAGSADADQLQRVQF